MMILSLIHLAATLAILARVVVVLNRTDRRTRLTYLVPLIAFAVAALATGLEPFFRPEHTTPAQMAFAVAAAVAAWTCARSNRRRRRLNQHDQ
ncbi:MAG: hypothetical protein REI09_05160 [Candidatus Dactylopiibacterium sp.]|nr:hypothetical protein [Candidatus Dactylopiibacterium sp.]